VFKKFFGKKNDGFYLQMEDEKVPQKPAAKAPAKSEPVATPAPTAVAVTPPAATAVVAVETAPAAKTDKKAAKAAKKSAKVDKKAPKQAEVPTPVVVAPAPPVPAITNFATDYLIKPSSRSSRRLPGANMNGFLELARQVKKPANIK
jgi:hypothetical protein